MQLNKKILDRLMKPAVERLLASSYDVYIRLIDVEPIPYDEYQRLVYEDLRENKDKPLKQDQ